MVEGSSYGPCGHDRGNVSVVPNCHVESSAGQGPSVAPIVLRSLGPGLGGPLRRMAAPQGLARGPSLGPHIAASSVRMAFPPREARGLSHSATAAQGDHNGESP